MSDKFVQVAELEELLRLIKNIEAIKTVDHGNEMRISTFMRLVPEAESIVLAEIKRLSDILVS